MEKKKVKETSSGYGFLIPVVGFLFLLFLIFQDEMPPTSKDRRFVPPDEEIKTSPSQPAEGRVALLIGNAAYPFAPLANPIRDVRILGSALKDCGFEVMAHEDLNNQQMIDAIAAFEDKLGRKEVGFFYFSGHGMQINGENFLVPVDAKCQRESQAAYECFNVGRLLSVMESAKNRVNIVILDACRNNPLARDYRSLSGGLAKMEAGNQMIIAYSTSPGDVAQDGPPEGNSGTHTEEPHPAIALHLFAFQNSRCLQNALFQQGVDDLFNGCFLFLGKLLSPFEQQIFNWDQLPGILHFGNGLIFVLIIVMISQFF